MTTPPRTRQEILDLTRETTLYEWTSQKAIKPMVIDRAEGIYLWDVDGKRYMDFNSQLMCVNIGHGDQRVIDLLVDEEISIGDYVLTNGAIAAVVVVDAVVRLIPGVLGDEASAVDDSFATGLLEFPHYTRPVEFQGVRVPEILLSGNHGAIAKWRQEQALAKTRRRRPDLLPPA